MLLTTFFSTRTLWIISCLSIFITNTLNAQNSVIDSIYVATQLKKGDSLKSSKEYDLALKTYKDVLTSNRIDISENTPTLGRLYFNLGYVCMKLGLFNEALTYQTEALRIRTCIYGELHEDVASSYIQIGNIYSYSLNFKSILEYYEKALNIRQQIHPKHHRFIVDSYISIANAYLHQKSIKKAILYYNKALETDKHNSNQHNRSVIYNNLSVCYNYLKNKKQAVFFAKKSFALNKEESYKRKAMIFEYAREYHRAIYFYKKAIKSQKNAYRKANFSFDIGTIYRDIKEYKNALPYYRKALHLYDSTVGKKNYDVSNSYSELAKVHFLQQEYTTAITYGDSALVAGTSEHHSEKKMIPSLFTNQELLLEILFYKAQSYKALYQQTRSFTALQKAVKTFRQAHACIVYTREQLTNHYDQLSFSKMSKEVYADAIDTHLLLYQYTQRPKDISGVFFYIEQSKANTLKGLIKDSKAKKYGNIPTHVLTLERDLKEKKADQQSRLNTASLKKEVDTIKIAAHKNQLFDITRQQDSLKLILKTQYPKYHRLIYNDTLLTLAQTQKRLDAATNILQYFVQDSSVYILTIAKNQCSVRKQTISALSDKITTFKKAIIAKDHKVYQKTAHDLYQHLIAPVKEQLTGSRLLIVPDEELWQLDFDLLLTKPTNTKHPNNFPYLLRDYAISYINATSLLRDYDRTAATAKNTLRECLAFSYASDDQNTTDATTLRLSTLRNTHTPLPGTSKEVKAIADIVKGTYYYGKQALETNFKKHAGRYNMLHLALHGEIDAKQPENSRLIFSKGNDSIDDHSLYAHELYALDLPAELAVLSACNTGTGKIATGEGVMSLGTAFQYAGTKSLVLTRWEVSDMTTPQLIKNFYQQLKKGAPKDIALQKAKLQYLEEGHIQRLDPFYWSSFYVLGDHSPIQLSNTNTAYYWVAILILCCLLTGILMYRRKKHRYREHTSSL